MQLSKQEELPDFRTITHQILDRKGQDVLRYFSTNPQPQTYFPPFKERYALNENTNKTLNYTVELHQPELGSGIRSAASLELIPLSYHDAHSLAANKLALDAINKYYSTPVRRRRGGHVLMNEPVC